LTSEISREIIVNSHCYKPYQPAIENDSFFQEEITHSKDYRKAGDRFSSKKVMVISGGPSRFDLSSEISSVATEV
jgi:cation diffusion facilitator CzcD-associated flavoprotein CzcO